MTQFANPAPQWPDLKTAAASLRRVGFFVDADGDLAYDEGITPTEFLSTDADGDLSADVTPPGTLRVAVLPSSDLYAY